MMYISSKKLAGMILLALGVEAVKITSDASEVSWWPPSTNCVRTLVGLPPFFEPVGRTQEEHLEDLKTTTADLEAKISDQENKLQSLVDERVRIMNRQADGASERDEDCYQEQALLSGSLDELRQQLSETNVERAALEQDMEGMDVGLVHHNNGDADAKDTKPDGDLSAVDQHDGEGLGIVQSLSGSDDGEANPEENQPEGGETTTTTETLPTWSKDTPSKTLTRDEFNTLFAYYQQADAALDKEADHEENKPKKLRIGKQFSKLFGTHVSDKDDCEIQRNEAREEWETYYRDFSNTYPSEEYTTEQKERIDQFETRLIQEEETRQMLSSIKEPEVLSDKSNTSAENNNVSADVDNTKTEEAPKKAVV